MNNEQAKFILRAYRPGGRDAGDAAFCEALRQAQADPALGTWLAREQAFDTAVAAKLQAIFPPSGLREAILTGARMSTSARPRPAWRPATWMVLAASFAVILTLAATYWLRGPDAVPTGLDQLAEFALADPVSAHTGPHVDKLGALGAWLQNPVNRISSGAPVDLAQLKAQDCRMVSIAGHEVFEICFNRGGHWYHLYIARRSDFDAGTGQPRFREQGLQSVVAWADQRLAYVLMGAGKAETLRGIL
ncbi:MAG: hypothetical protein PHE83_05360 [Opitutaceae bacterium]|nr:hypothetical protein [Opitutaceae bacterium]